MVAAVVTAGTEAAGGAVDTAVDSAGVALAATFDPSVAPPVNCDKGGTVILVCVGRLVGTIEALICDSPVVPSGGNPPDNDGNVAVMGGNVGNALVALVTVELALGNAVVTRVVDIVLGNEVVGNTLDIEGNAVEDCTLVANADDDDDDDTLGNAADTDC